MPPVLPGELALAGVRGVGQADRLHHGGAEQHDDEQPLDEAAVALAVEHAVEPVRLFLLRCLRHLDGRIVVEGHRSSFSEQSAAHYLLSQCPILVSHRDRAALIGTVNPLTGGDNAGATRDAARSSGLSARLSL